MRTNIVVDDDLLEEVRLGFGVKTKREAIDRALRAAARKQRQLRAWDELRGSGWVGDLEAMRLDKPLQQSE